MAYGRRYWRRYYRRYYRGKYGYGSYGGSSANKLAMSRNFKASAKNMTQGGTFNISVRKIFNVTIGNGDTSYYNEFPVAAEIKGSDMHTYLSAVFDQYRIEKVAIRIRPCGDNQAQSLATGIGNNAYPDGQFMTNPAILFSCVDRSGFAQNPPLSTLRTYGSYKESQISGARDVSPTHYIAIGASNLVEWSTYTDTKVQASFPHVYLGVSFAKALSADRTIYLSVEVDAQIRYRGVRLDLTDVPHNP